MPYFPLALHLLVFMVVGNHLGQFLHVGEDVLKGTNKILGQMMVEIDVTKGFLDEIEIEWRDRTSTQKLDCWGLPFRCSICKEAGHIWRARKSSSTYSANDGSLYFMGTG